MPGDADLVALQQRKTRLLARSAALRGALVREAAAWERPLGVADGALVLVRWVHAQRYWVIGAAALLLAARPRRALRWARRGWWLWRLSRRLRPWLAVAVSLRHPIAPNSPAARLPTPANSAPEILDATAS